ncbi:hypothetical protein LTR91_015422 [Friedmanniomyces endolithicus]|uniref:Metallo-beta-lactamase domain-containing protein n=1 Tax=Friedmanniomyces endolithicus TaxID=329885 RepID=A0AAN6QLS6_9PEZI|nr:hypothetical protein LTR57_017541 [Friedmanniomyces endolithicus]KAK0971688.1 hypothetical protein LTR91_015422 [Friedmanniomyces endolithicus]KAK0990163.1 hypothetical protein LTS01_008578 [Friedmanniomyces endolithicus]KAK1030020.1 hypothetical protein LTS16_019208 [Friedmanniomyces endolithicus]KAK1057362.1 hypothetical protein LTR33_013656 [Friedmanniomyces endolithicus]
MAALVELDSLEILVVVDNEYGIPSYVTRKCTTNSSLGSLDPISPCPNPAVQQSGSLKDLGINGSSITTNDRGDAKKELRMDSICCSAHGLSLLITGVVGNKRHTMLFDTGPENRIFELNAQRLRAPLGDIEAIHLSHWHRDHSGGMLKVLEMAGAAGAKSISVDLHPDRPDYRGIIAMAPISMEADPTFEEIEKAGGRVEKHGEAHGVLENCFMVSGEIPRVTKYELGLKRGIRFAKETGKWEEDTLIKDERYLMCKLKGAQSPPTPAPSTVPPVFDQLTLATDKGLVLFTGCSHAGVVNASRNAVDLGSGTPLYAVMGGYHLADAEPELISDSVADLKALEPKVLLAGHCTGWRAKFEIERQMPGRLVPSFVGSKFVL